MNGARRSLILIAAVLALAPALARAGTPCNDCCQMPCVEAEIKYATKIQDWYRSQQGIRNLTLEQYEAAEKAKAAELARERARAVGKLTACTWKLPDPKKDPLGMKRWNLVKWSVKEDDKGNLEYDFSMKTNVRTCELREDQISLYHEIAPCAGIADAAEQHERAHVRQCGPRGGRVPTVAEIVKGEVDAYDVELKELNALRESLQKVCDKGTCKDKETNTGEVRRQLEKELEDLKKEIAKRGGK
jgi:DNA repair exonuclease SbcCD ATPase subunit